MQSGPITGGLAGGLPLSRWQLCHFLPIFLPFLWQFCRFHPNHQSRSGQSPIKRKSNGFPLLLNVMRVQSRVGFVVINIWLTLIQHWALFSSKLWLNIAAAWIQGLNGKYGRSHKSLVKHKSKCVRIKPYCLTFTGYIQRKMHGCSPPKVSPLPKKCYSALSLWSTTSRNISF